MKKVSKQPTIKDLRTTLNVLATLTVPVPDEVFVEISAHIQQREEAKLTRRLNRMSEEQLIQYTSRQKKILRVVLPDGRLIQGKTNDITFVEALRTIAPEQLAGVTYWVRTHPLVVYDDTVNKRMYKHYYILSPGVLIYGKTTGAEKKSILEMLDQKLQLNWEITLI